jgi:hypothetical protein
MCCNIVLQCNNNIGVTTLDLLNIARFKRANKAEAVAIRNEKFASSCSGVAKKCVKEIAKN